MATSRDTVERLLLQEGVIPSLSAVELIKYYNSIPHTVSGYVAEYACGTRNGAMGGFYDTLETRACFQAVAGEGQCKCLHCFKSAGHFDKADGREPIIIYARPCEKHQLLHPTAYDIGQWCLHQVGLDRTYIHEPLGGLAVLWVDKKLLGQIDVQLLRQDNKEDRAAGIDAYSFCNKVSNISMEYPETKAKLVMAHTHVAMVMKWEHQKWAPLCEADVEGSTCEVGTQSETIIEPVGVTDYRRRGITSLERGPTIVVVPVSSTCSVTCNVVAPNAKRRVSALPGSCLERSTGLFPEVHTREHFDEGMHADDEILPGDLTTVFTDSGSTSAGSDPEYGTRPLKDTEDSGNGYTLPPPPGIEAGGVIGDPAAVDISGSSKVRGGEVKVASRVDPQKYKLCAAEWDLHRRIMGMESDLHDGECGSLTPQFYNIGPKHMEAGTLHGVKVSAKTLSNALRALTDRHFKIDDSIGKVGGDGKRALQKAVSTLTTHMMRTALDHGVIDEIHERMVAMPERYKSKKWSTKTFLDSLRSAGLNQSVALKKSVHVKPNETLSKEKPRAIIESGPTGVITHLFDAALLEDLIFNIPFFEQRSIKHATMNELCQRMQNMCRRYAFTASLDFGAFDGSLGNDIRTEVEKSLLNGLVGHLVHACQFTSDALRSREGEKLTASVQREAKLIVEEKIRESGDRGTSILNFITSLCAFLAVVVLLCWRNKISDNAITQMLSEFFQGRGELFDLMAEGDDGQQFFGTRFLLMLGYGKDGVPDHERFGVDFYSLYAELGLRIEPQAATGEVTFDKALTKTTGRIEFCSKIFVFADGVGAWLPKPAKTFVGGQVSFDVSQPRSVAGMTKSLALMCNTICCEVMFEYFSAMYRWHRQQASDAEVVAVQSLQDSVAWSYFREQNKLLVTKSADEQYNALRRANDGIRLEGIDRSIERAFCQETGMCPNAQRDWARTLRSLNGGDFSWLPLDADLHKMGGPSRPCARGFGQAPCLGYK